VEPWETVQLAQPTSGHFDLSTGYHGDLWLDLDALFLQLALFLVLGVLTGVAAGIRPSRRAARLNPLTAIATG